MSEKYIKIKGKMNFIYTTKGIEIMLRDLYSEYEKDILDISYVEEISGKDFLNDVIHGSIMDYDGSLCNVVVDGYDSNLGLFSVDKTSNFTQGYFLVNPDAWSDICEKHDVKVYWANK